MTWTKQGRFCHCANHTDKNTHFTHIPMSMDWSKVKSSPETMDIPIQYGAFRLKPPLKSLDNGGWSKFSQGPLDHQIDPPWSLRLPSVLMHVFTVLHDANAVHQILTPSKRIETQCDWHVTPPESPELKKSMYKSSCWFMIIHVDLSKPHINWASYTRYQPVSMNLA